MTKPKKKVTVTRQRVTLGELKKLVAAVQAAGSLTEVATAMGWKIEKVRTQVTRLRKADVPLKEFPKKGKLSEADVAGLAELCKPADVR